MIKSIAVIASAFYYTGFTLVLFIFQPLQWLALKLGGYNAHKIVADYFNLSVMNCLLLLGSRVKIINEYNIPNNTSLIFVANHQSMQDVAPIAWYFRKFHPKFVSKIELGKGIPSISFNLKHGGSVLIDRKNARQSLTTIKNFAQYLEKNKYAGVIFPEGTRSRDGFPRKFSDNGLKIMVKYMPTSYIVPLTINNSWKTLKYGKFPLKIGTQISIKVQQPIAVKALNFDELFLEVEKSIKKDIISPPKT